MQQLLFRVYIHTYVLDLIRLRQNLSEKTCVNFEKFVCKCITYVENNKSMLCKKKYFGKICKKNRMIFDTYLNKNLLKGHLLYVICRRRRKKKKSLPKITLKNFYRSHHFLINRNLHSMQYNLI